MSHKSFLSTDIVAIQRILLLSHLEIALEAHNTSSIDGSFSPNGVKHFKAFLDEDETVRGSKCAPSAAQARSPLQFNQVNVTGVIHSNRKGNLANFDADKFSKSSISIIIRVLNYGLWHYNNFLLLILPLW